MMLQGLQHSGCIACYSCRKCHCCSYTQPCRSSLSLCFHLQHQTYDRRCGIAREYEDTRSQTSEIQRFVEHTWSFSVYSLQVLEGLWGDPCGAQLLTGSECMLPSTTESPRKYTPTSDYCTAYLQGCTQTPKGNVKSADACLCISGFATTEHDRLPCSSPCYRSPVSFVCGHHRT